MHISPLFCLMYAEKALILHRFKKKPAKGL